MPNIRTQYDTTLSHVESKLLFNVKVFLIDFLVGKSSLSDLRCAGLHCFAFPASDFV